MTTIESFLASQTVKFVTLPYPRRASYSKRTVNTWCGWNYCYNLCYISFSKYMYNKNNNSIFNISACLINNQSKLYLVYNVFNLSQPRHLINFWRCLIIIFSLPITKWSSLVQTSLFALRWESNPHRKHTLFDSTVELPRGVFVWLTWWYYYNILFHKSQ